jgi:hypothetical protein
MIMPRLTFEEPLGGPLAKATQRNVEKNAQETAQQVEPDQAKEPVEHPTEQLSDLFVADEDVEEQDGDGRHRRTPEQRDAVLVVLKAVTVAAGLALVGLVILLTTSGGDEPAATSPSVPDIPASGQSSAGPATTTADVGAMIAPPVHSNTTEIVPPPTVTQPTVTTDKPGGGQNQFVRVGEPCDTAGAYAFTERYEPVVCGGGRNNDRLVWRRMFR